MRQKFEFHPAAAIFPLMEGLELEALKRDILQNGQIKPIELWDDMVLDGRNRLTACRLAGITPKVQRLDRLVGSSPVAHVLSANLHRRHLNPTQLAMVGARARSLFDEEARKRRAHQMRGLPGGRPGMHGDARDLAGLAVGVSGRSIDAATLVLKQGAPEIVEACDRGELSVSRAAKLANLPKDAQQRALLEVGSGRALALAHSSPRRPDSDELSILLSKAASLHACLERQLQNMGGYASARSHTALVACADQVDRLGLLFSRLGQEVRSMLDNDGRTANAS